MRRRRGLRADAPERRSLPVRHRHGEPEVAPRAMFPVMRRLSAALMFVCACGGPPVLAGAPRPDPGVVAAIAAAVATGATIADPSSAGKKPEAARVSQSEAA